MSVQCSSPVCLHDVCVYVCVCVKERERETETETETEAEGEAGSMQGAQHGTRSQIPGIMPWTEGGAKLLSHRGHPR